MITFLIALPFAIIFFYFFDYKPYKRKKRLQRVYKELVKKSLEDNKEYNDYNDYWPKECRALNEADKYYITSHSFKMIIDISNGMVTYLIKTDK